MATNNIGYYIVKLDHRNEWRWTFYAANHRVIAVASEGYVNRADCIHALNLTASSAGCPVHFQ